jgi:hypothetical protein
LKDTFIEASDTDFKELLSRAMTAVFQELEGLKREREGLYGLLDGQKRAKEEITSQQVCG